MSRLIEENIAHDFDEGFDKGLEFIMEHLNKSREKCAIITLPENPKLKDYAFMITPLRL